MLRWHLFICVQFLPATWNLLSAADLNGAAPVESGFWDTVYGKEYISKLNSDNLTEFLTHHENSFVMFYANWCRASHMVKEGFAEVAEEITYTEGFNIAFGAFDCNATLSNRHVCNKYDIAKYPRFLYFTLDNLDRLYNVRCPRTKEYFYSWIVNKGNEVYCSTASASVDVIKLPLIYLTVLITCYFTFLQSTN